MSSIVNGNFTDHNQAKLAVAALASAGFASDQISFFKVELPGHHLDRPASEATPLAPDASETKVPEGGAGALSGAAVGGAIGAVIALATLPVLGPMVAAAAVGVGAYGGSLYGVLDSMEGDATTATAEKIMASQEARHRQSGTLVAVIAGDQELQNQASQILIAQGASDVELTAGQLSYGVWTDFNPRLPLKLIA